MKTTPYKINHIVIVILLVLNLFLIVYIAFLKPSVYTLETLKAGGKENMQMAKQLYTSDIYVQQQKSTLQQILEWINQVNTVPFDDSFIDISGIDLE